MNSVEIKFIFKFSLSTARILYARFFIKNINILAKKKRKEVCPEMKHFMKHYVLPITLKVFEVFSIYSRIINVALVLSRNIKNSTK